MGESCKQTFPILLNYERVHISHREVSIQMSLRPQATLNHSLSLVLQVGIIALVFMNKANHDAYVEVFRRMKQELPELSVAAYMGDYDAAMRGAVEAEFSGVRLYGCLFHYAQSILKYASDPKVGLARDIRGPGAELKDSSPSRASRCCRPMTSVRCLKNALRRRSP